MTETPPVSSGDVLRLEIADLAFGGRGLARVGRFVVFVPGALPGEAVRARIDRVRRGYAEATCLDLLTRSPERTAPPCRHFGVCGGCDLQHLSRGAQARSKRAQIRTLLERIGGIEDPPVSDAIEGGDPAHYRFRMDFDWGRTPGGRLILGLHRSGRPSELVSIETCLLLPEPADALRAAWLRRAEERKLQPWEPKHRRGLLRRLSVQMARATGEILTTLETGRGDPPSLGDLARSVARAFPRIVGVVRHEFDREDRFVGASILLGRDHLFEEVDGDRFKIPAGAFFQPNASGWSLLRRVVLEQLRPQPHETFLELDCGVGFFTLPLARRCREVTALDVSRPAIASARENAAVAGIGNIRFHCGDADARVEALLSGRGFDGVLLDPPRVGLGRPAAAELSRAKTSRMVYVSCDPSTLARDLRILCEGGKWSLESLVPLDLFPQTHHVECVARLVRTER